MDRICWGGQKAFIYDNAVFGRMEECIVRIALERARGVSLDKQELEAWYLMYDRQRITGRRSDDGIIFFVLGTRRSPRDGESSQTRVSRQSKTSHISHTLNNFLAPQSPPASPRNCDRRDKNSKRKAGRARHGPAYDHVPTSKLPEYDDASSIPSSASPPNPAPPQPWKSENRQDPWPTPPSVRAHAAYIITIIAPASHRICVKATPTPPRHTAQGTITPQSHTVLVGASTVQYSTALRRSPGRARYPCSEASRSCFSWWVG